MFCWNVEIGATDVMSVVPLVLTQGYKVQRRSIKENTGLKSSCARSDNGGAQGTSKVPGLDKQKQEAEEKLHLNPFFFLSA